MATHFKTTGVDVGGDSITASAWVQFNSVGTLSIAASFGASSVTDVGVGQFTLNFSPTLGSANYSSTHSTQESASGSDHPVGIDRFSGPSRTTQTASAYKFAVVNISDYSGRDCARNSVTVFGER